ncbi:MAG: heavy-metal-associated domain-containing protein [Gemmatimonadota bacterium]
MKSGGLFTAALLLAPASLQAQALPFHTETAITTGFEEEAARTFAAFGGRGGLVRDGQGIADPMRRDVDVFVQPVAVLPYAIGPMWTTRVILPYVRKTMDFTTPDGMRRRYATSGVGDAILDTKWVFLSRNRLKGTTRLGIEGGVKIPLGTTEADLPDGSVAPRPLQVGTGSWDFPLKALLTGTVAALALAMGLATPRVAAAQVAAAPAERQPAEAEAPEPRRIEVTILGMSCPFCAYGVEQKLKRLEGVEDIDVALDTGLATLTMEEGGDLSNDLIRKSVKDAGFEVANIVRNFESEFPSFMKMRPMRGR